LNKPLRILVVDDNRDAADSVALLLRLWGHTVEVAYDGQAAISAAVSFKPQAVLLDVSMPSMHGGIVARRLRELAQFRAAMIIATTANHVDDPRLDEWRRYFDSFLAKPYNLATLEELLAHHAASQA
jgi:CheY-like chemotaxis protein